MEIACNFLHATARSATFQRSQFALVSYRYRDNVCPSIRPSQANTKPSPSKIDAANFHRIIAGSLSFVLTVFRRWVKKILSNELELQRDVALLK